ncbi:MAG: ribonuclease HI [Xanthomonadaceae bacterium]|nr:ribonuclease HI [Xanthomonadaceae bacterium]
MKDKIIVFTDGAASGNPGPGGWGCILRSGSTVTELGGGEAHTTNNRMELYALIAGLEKIPSDHAEDILVYSDSSYVLSGAEKNLSNWKKRDWKTMSGDPVKNQDLWKRLDEILQTLKNKITWNLVPGHEGVPGNERCDEIAVTFSKGGEADLYSGDAKKYKIDLTYTPSLGGKKSKNPWYLSLVDGKLEKHITWCECENRVKGKRGVKFKKVASQYEEDKTLESWNYKK